MELNLAGLTLGWREGLLALILLIVAYMVWLLWGMRRIARKKEAPSPFVEPRVVHHYREQQQAATQEIDDERVEEAEVPAPVWTETHDHMGQQAFMDGVERELEQIREEMDALRGALASLREEMGGVRQELEQEVLSVRAAQNTSPLYSEAMQMAILGHDALTIAERCGISRAEAELVVALVKNKDAEHP